MNIVMGSQSPRRLEILRTVVPKGMAIKVIPADIDEKAIRFAGASALTLAVALAKNRAVQLKLAWPAIVVTADTVAVCGGRIREKPETTDELRAFLDSYRNGLPAECVTSVVVVNTLTGFDPSATDTATVTFKWFGTARVEEIVRTQLFFGAAGGFIIKHPLFVDLIRSISGDPETVEGLPGRLTKLLIKDAIGG
jgi:septum formation protein